jgi:beta-galactosidase GanA
MKTILLAFMMLCTPVSFGQHAVPRLEKTGNRHRLLVNEKPFLMLGGELGNSTASTMESMEPVWQRLKALNLNTVLLPIYWELLEPQESKFDFELVDNLIFEARKHDLKLVILWFGAWKNSMSSHVPAWVKLDQDRFPRAKSPTESQEILTPFATNNLEADTKAYVALLNHIRKVDASQQTVILMQPENEIGMLPSARDYHPLANAKFSEQVPQALVDYLVQNKATLNPEFLEVWSKQGFQTKGSWEDIFGKGTHTDELFMAYYFGLYTEALTAAGKAAYPLPAFVNAALNRPNVKPGDYPSAGPLPHVLDLWKAAAPSIDFYSPDFYNPDFKHWNDLYVRQDNPLFIPEHRFDNTVAAKALFALGHYEALGFAPFSIEQLPQQPMNEKEVKLSKVYEMVAEIKPLLDKHRGQNKVKGVLLDKDASEMVFTLGDYEFTASHTFNLGWEPNITGEDWEPAGAIVIQTGENEFYYAGFGVSLKMKHLIHSDVRVGILKTDKGRFKDGKWTVFQHLNGDQTHQGRHIRSFVNDVSIQRFTLYTYK